MRVLTVVVSLCLVALVATGVQAAVVQEAWVGTTLTPIAPNGMGNGVYSSVSSTINNVIGGGSGNGSLYCNFELAVAFGGAVNANAAAYIWYLRSIDDGTTFGTTPSSTIVTGPPDVVIPIANVAGSVLTQKTVKALCYQGHFRVIMQMNNTGQTVTGSGNTLKLRFSTPQVN
jgi:hypothetical protein